MPYPWQLSIRSHWIETKVAAGNIQAGGDSVDFLGTIGHNFQKSLLFSALEPFSLEGDVPADRLGASLTIKPSAVTRDQVTERCDDEGEDVEARTETMARTIASRRERGESESEGSAGTKRQRNNKNNNSRESALAKKMIVTARLRIEQKRNEAVIRAWRASERDKG
ncbi:hypothetical protein B0H14DRAFT_2649998 [Mycena olivaceomarginata]|nr:hypothetical protein B0H14DRAFT_2649998 [Mycena olivaceomarginata]